MRNDNSRTSIYPQDKITIAAVTWNLFASVPPVNSLVQLARSSSFSPPPDLIFIGTQECERSLLMTLCCEAKNEWEAMLVEVFSQYYLATTIVMRGLHTAVLLRPALRSYFSIQSSSKLKAGTCGIMGNKGAISLEFNLLGQSFQMLNCHLAPHQTGSEIRNQTVNRILDELLKVDLRYEIIFLGDFNYRIEMTKDEYRSLSGNSRENTDESAKYSSLFHKEQLSNQQDLKRNFLLKFQEGRINFPPTYKIGVSSNDYNRDRIPGWTDRIFARKPMGPNSMQRQSYKCEYNIMGCDHRPVIARYTKSISQKQIHLPNDYLANERNQSLCQLI